MYKVLIAEDEAIVRLGLKNMLDWESMGMQVTALAGDGEEAWQLYCEGSPDIVITDIRMPRLDGMELIRRIRRMSAGTKIIILTCIDDLTMVQQALEMGATGYILKLTAGIEEVARLLNKAKSALDEERIVQESRGWFDVDAIRQKIWSEYVVERSMGLTEFEEYARKAGLCPEDAPLQLLVFRLPDYERLRDGSDSLIHRRKYIRDVIRNFLAKYPYGECFQHRGGEYGILYGVPEECTPEEAEGLCGEVIQSLAQALYQNVGIRVNCGVSNVEKGYSGLPGMYLRALKNLEEKEGEGLPLRVAQAVRYIQENFHRELSLQSVAEKQGISANYLSHMFTGYLNISFTNYLNNVRVEYSKKLLSDPSLKIYEISGQVGFYSPAYFIRVFKNATGLTPTEYRNGGGHAT